MPFGLESACLCDLGLATRLVQVGEVQRGEIVVGLEGQRFLERRYCLVAALGSRYQFPKVMWGESRALLAALDGA